MFGKRFDLFTIFGFTVRIDLSWFIVAVLVAWSLAAGFFPNAYKDLTPLTYWTMGVVGALGLFASVVLHELSHSLVARRQGMEMKGITLFIFGGVAEMSDEPPSPRAELLVAIAGPICSAVLGALGVAVGLVGRQTGWPIPVHGVISYLGLINLLLVAFNLVPAFPLDGGRVLRSILWQWKDNLRWATRVTSQIGSVFGFMLIGLGVVSVLMGNFVGGMWWFLIGLFLRGAAQMSYQQLLVRRMLEGEPVSRFMRENPITVPRSISVEELVDNYVYEHHHKLYPVVDNGHLVGCVTTDEIKSLPRDEWQSQSVGAISHPCDDTVSVSPDEDAMNALSRMQQSGKSRLMVVRGDQLVGILTLRDLMDLFAMKLELEHG